MEDSRKNLHTDDTVYRVKTATFLNEKRSSTRVELKKNVTISGRGRSLHIRTCGYLSLFVTGSIYLSVVHCLWIDFL